MKTISISVDKDLFKSAVVSFLRVVYTEIVCLDGKTEKDKETLSEAGCLVLMATEDVQAEKFSSAAPRLTDAISKVNEANTIVPIDATTCMDEMKRLCELIQSAE